MFKHYLKRKFQAGFAAFSCIRGKARQCVIGIANTFSLTIKVSYGSYISHHGHTLTQMDGSYSFPAVSVPTSCAQSPEEGQFCIILNDVFVFQSLPLDNLYFLITSNRQFFS